MTFKSAVKLSFLNLDKVWKYVLYRIVVWAIIIGLMSPCFNAISNTFKDFTNSSAFKEFLSAGLFYSGTITDVARGIIVEVWAFITLLATNQLFVLIYYAFLLLVLLPTLMNMGKYTVNSMMYGYMSSYAKQGFCTTYVSSFGKAFVFGICRSLFNLVFNMSAILLFVGLVNIPSDGFEYVMPYIFVVLGALMLTLKQMLVFGWAPSMLVCGMNVVRAFGFGIKTTFRRFGISFVTSFTVYLLSLLLFIGFGIYSLIVIVPMFSIVISIAEMILFFGNHGMKYYIDGDTIISPKRHEELDKIKQIKFLL